MKTLSILMAIFVNPFIAWFMIYPVTPLDHLVKWEAVVWLEIKVVAGILVMIIAVLNFWGNTQSVHARKMLFAELLLLFSGAGSINWGIHLSSGWMIVYGGCLVTQGVTALWGLAVDHEHIVEWREIRK